MTDLEPDPALAALVRELDGLPGRIAAAPVTRPAPPERVRAAVAEAFPLDRPLAAGEALSRAARLLAAHGVQVTHPRYFGLFNPSVRGVAVAADALASAYNAQLAAYSHAPAAVEMERHALGALAGRLGLPAGSPASFTTGGAEANLQALLCALAAAEPAWAERGVAAFDRPPVIYTSAESHHSILKAARAAGLGTDALRRVSVGPGLALDPDALRRAVAEDRGRGLRPLVVVATAGTTGAGVIDPLPAIAGLAAAEGLWLHVDAAYGGAAVLSGRLRPALAGIERADSITWDAHKWLSVPIGAGMFFCRHAAAVERAFGVTTGYMPAAAEAAQDPFTTTIQWSRRALGLKVLLALAELGLHGWGDLVDAMATLGDLLRARLTRAGWTLRNTTPLPVVCAVPPAGGPSPGAIAREVQARGRAWISEVLLPGGPAVRACVTSFRSTEADVDVLVEELERARRAATG